MEKAPKKYPSLKEVAPVTLSNRDRKRKRQEGYLYLCGLGTDQRNAAGRSL